MSLKTENKMLKVKFNKDHDVAGIKAGDVVKLQKIPTHLNGLVEEVPDDTETTFDKNNREFNETKKKAVKESKRRSKELDDLDKI